MRKIGKRVLAAVLFVSMSMSTALSYLPDMWRVHATDETPVDHSFEIGFKENFGTKLDAAFNVYEYGSAFHKISGAASNTGKPSALATTGGFGTRNQGYLKLKGAGNGKSAFLTYMTPVTDFTAEYTFYTYNSQIAGLVFGGGAGTFPITFDNNNANDTGVMIYLEHSDSYGKVLNIGGAIDRTTTNYLGGTVDGKDYSTQSFMAGTSNIRGTKAITDKVYKGSTWVESTDDAITLVVTVNKGLLTVYEKDTPDRKVTVKLTDSYQGGYVSLYQNLNSYNTSFKAFKIAAIEEEPPVEIPVQPATEGDKFTTDFTKITAITDLDKDYDSYYFASAGLAAEKGKPSMQWSTADNLVDYASYKNNYLKPVHRSDGNKLTLLTYQSKSFKNVEIAAGYAPNHLRYGIMIAPKGELATAQNGIRIYVEGGGAINIEGAIDAGSGTAKGGYVYVNNRNHLKGYSLSGQGYISASSQNSNSVNNTIYNLHARISGNTLDVWVEEFLPYVLTVTLTDEYEGGMVSLYSNGHNHGGFKTFSAQEMENVQVVKDETVYTKSFNTISSLDELGDFKAYTLASIEEKPKESNIGNVFRLNAGRMCSNASVNGTYNDDINFGILTLTKKRYENFELTLKYQQNSLRYGVMFGTEEGEFAYSRKGASLRGNGGVFVYTEMEGYRNIKGSVDAKAFASTDDAKKLLARMTDKEPLKSFTAFTAPGVSNAVATLRQEPIHTMTIRVVNGNMTMIIDNNELSRMTVHLSDYDGGYISLVTSSMKSGDHGAFLRLSVRELGEDAELGTTAPEVSDGFKTIGEVENMFDAYYLENVKESSKYEAKEVADRWFVNKDGFITKIHAGSGITVNEGVDILTYNKQKFTDFELTYTYQQAYHRLGIIIGSEKDTYPLQYSNKKLTADKGALFYVEAEGYPNVKGSLHNYTLKSDLLYRISRPGADGYQDAAGSPTDNVNARKVHTVKIIVKEKQLYAFIDNSKEANLYVKLGDNYQGGYVSLFSAANSNYGFGSFEISSKITTELPKAGGTASVGNTFVADFNTAKFDASKFTTYYLEAVKGNAKGTMKRVEFDDHWTVANGSIQRTTEIANGSDASKVSVLTYEKAMTDFIVTYDYQQDTNRLMFMFGAEKGKYPLYEGQGGQQKENGGVVLYPEYDIGGGGGVVALGEAVPATTSHRPLHRVTIRGIDYYDKNSNVSHKGNWHKITIAVINKQCFIYIDDYGLVDQFALKDDYNGGYLSIASSGNAYGFDNLSITDLSAVSGNTVVAAEVPRHLTVTAGTESSALQLPSTVKVTLKSGKTVQASVDWKNFNYDGATTGIYKYTGIIKESAGIENPAKVGVEIDIKVVGALLQSNKNVKTWSFDTKDDLNDFKATYLQDSEKGYVSQNKPVWWVSKSDGRLYRDEFRTVNGTEKTDLGILTYTGETYKNFELEVDYSWSSTRMMVMFGSEKAGQYVDLNHMKSNKNPVAVFVEMEGVRNVIGNVRNTDYYRRTETTISSARDNGDYIPNYYNAENLASNKGTMRHMKIRVVGDQVSVWVGTHEEPFVATMTNYKGGYISLVSCSKGGMFDNLKITRLSDSLSNSQVKNVKAVANGTMNLTIDEKASTEQEIPKEVVPEVFETKNEISKQKSDAINGISMKTILLGGSVILGALLAGGVIILLAAQKRKKGEKR